MVTATQPPGKGYREIVVNGRTIYASNYTNFKTPHLSKIKIHVARQRAKHETFVAAALTADEEPADADEVDAGEESSGGDE